MTTLVNASLSNILPTRAGYVEMMSKEATTVKALVFGGGARSAAGLAHASALALSQSWEVLGGVFSSNEKESRAHVNSKLWNLSSSDCFGTIEEAINDLGALATAAIILTPSPAHEAHIRLCLEAGLDVVVEKPVALSFEKGKQLHKLARDCGRRIFTIYNYLYYPQVLAAARIVQSGEIGDPRFVSVRMIQDGYIRTGLDGEVAMPQEWRKTDPPSIPMVYLDLGTHVLSLIQGVCGSLPTEIAARHWTSGGVKDVIDSVDFLGDDGKGLVFQGTFGKAFLGRRNELQFEVFGTSGSLAWQQDLPDLLRLSDERGTPRFLSLTDTLELFPVGISRFMRFKPGHPTGWIEALANNYIDISCQIDGEKTVLPTHRFEEAIEGLEVLESIATASARFAQNALVLGSD